MADKIDLKKKYRTRDGREVRVYATDGIGTMCVHGATLDPDGWILRQWDAFGTLCPQLGQRDSDIVEAGPYGHIKIGDPVYVWDAGDHSRRKGYFAGFKGGTPCSFYEGNTEWSSGGDMTGWDYCELAYDALPDNDPRKNQKPE